MLLGERANRIPTAFRTAPSDQGQIDFLTEQEDNSGTAFSSRIDQFAVGTRAIWSLAPLMEPLTEPEPNQQQEIDMKK